MKKLIFNFLFVAALAFSGSLALTSCGAKSNDDAHEHAEGEEHADDADADQKHETEEGEGHDHDGEEMAYACPMHPEEKGKEGDTCSKCKMDLEKVKTEIEE